MNNLLPYRGLVVARISASEKELVACSLCYKTIAQFHQKCSLMRDCSLFRRLLLSEYTVYYILHTVKVLKGTPITTYHIVIASASATHTMLTLQKANKKNRLI